MTVDKRLHVDRGEPRPNKDSYTSSQDKHTIGKFKLERCMAMLVARRPSLKVKILSLNKEGEELERPLRRYVKRMAKFLGTWDILEAIIVDNLVYPLKTWAIPQANEEDPMEILRDVRGLFEGQVR
ncbi:hypothetical protein J1614_002920 [Plenodomus biglobosus]|nr:hypothetical protein J1614_002920 [Plenodomus biglobosus]